MDPLSVLGAAGSVASSLISASTALYKYIQAGKKVDRTVRQLQIEIGGLRLVVEAVKTSLEQPSLRDPVIAADAPVTLWLALHQALGDCGITTDELEGTLPQQDVKPGFWNKAVQQWKLGLVSDDVKDYRAQIQSHASCLQLSLQTIQLSVKTFNTDVAGDLFINFSHIACQTPSRLDRLFVQVGKLKRLESSSQQIEGQTKETSDVTHRMRETARQMISRAETIVESNTIAGSQNSFDNNASVQRHIGTRVDGWMSSLPDF